MSTASALAPCAQFPASGEVLLGKYRLEAPIGTGGQGAVWRALNLGLETPVAIKLVHRGSDELPVKRLLREARTVARLSHPAVVRVFDVEQTAEGDVFIVMELLEGETLGQLLDRIGRIPAEAAIRMLLPVADALCVVHAAGVVHRDVKPDNIFLVHSEGRIRPKLIDFGTVKVARADGLSTTIAGTFVGTPAYLAPEQVAHCEEVDPRADIWSFCVTLYECVTGGLPFEASTPTQALLAALEQEPSRANVSTLGDAELWAIIRRGLCKDPELRWSSFDELGAALARWVMARGVVDDACGVRIAREWLTRSPNPPPPLARNLGGTRTDAHRARQDRLEQPLRQARGLRALARRRRMFASVTLATAFLGVVGFSWAFIPRPGAALTPPPLPAPALAPPEVSPSLAPQDESAPVPPASPSLSPPPAKRTAPNTEPTLPARSEPSEAASTVVAITRRSMDRPRPTRPEPRPVEPPLLPPVKSLNDLPPLGPPLVVVTPARGSRARRSSSDLIDPY